ncbi:MAG: hypothetical protein ACM3VZ_13460 [Acidobacteriota bacterium]
MTGREAWTRVRALGLPGALGLTLIVLWGWLQWQWLPAHQAQADSLASDVRRLRHALQDGPDPQRGATRSTRPAWDVSGLPADQAWQAVWDALPDESQRLSLLKAVTTSAGQLTVSVPSVQYRGAAEPWSAHQGQVLWRERVALPVEGRYGDVRAWLGTLLNQSNLSVDAVEVNRSDTTTDQVKGRVALSLWWRAKEGVKP